MNFFITTFLLFLFPFFLSLGNQTYAISDYLNPTNSNKENNNSLKPIKRTKRAPVANKDESEEKRKYVPALLKKPRIGINIFQYNSKGFAGLGLHSKSYDLFLSIRSESDNSQPISKIETTDILTQFNLKAKITQKSFFSYGIGYKTTSGKQQSLQSSGNRTITNEEERRLTKIFGRTVHF